MYLDAGNILASTALILYMYAYNFISNKTCFKESAADRMMTRNVFHLAIPLKLNNISYCQRQIRIFRGMGYECII